MRCELKHRKIVYQLPREKIWTYAAGLERRQLSVTLPTSRSPPSLGCVGVATLCGENPCSSVLASRGLDRSESRTPVDTVLEAVSEI